MLTQQVNSLLQNNLDAGIVAMPVPVGTAAHIATKTIKRGNLIVALPEHHPLARQEQLTLAELACSPWILFPESEGPGLFKRITDACAVSGFTPVIVQRAVQMETIIGLVAAQMGIALVPENMSHHGWKGVAFRTLAGSGTPIFYHLALAWRKNDITTTLHALIDIISESDDREI